MVYFRRREPKRLKDLAPGTSHATVKVTLVSKARFFGRKTSFRMTSFNIALYYYPRFTVSPGAFSSFSR